MKYRISAVIGFCLALFLSSFIYSLMTNDDQSQEAYAFRPGIVPVISASGDNSSQLSAFSQEIPMASITAPFVLDIGPVDSYPDYLIVVSIIGIVCSLLIMNWLSRLRA
jgi:ABC-type antimicrobial peptide transport system permease subunit